ncbi:bifunctional alpha,alpha-trehalose-phosphate synthase (UDP-forming)/trehalose-phosphatase [Segetibacter sp. 3557_3]|uniref:bifunctional alpha,alpha-trehalose-phosphate synthase (UDP-forming)/trehalose-phosphatase n=1 Tax=Segetibacter sp. 3557_3 TaxID=2547429 RepID=UPI001058A73C|nr:bifunctional alpha,alpha-trehalose-phosphate synthase (UDP-forming)/trehalose-phosphatase [Segetibacter sp. 3557_3]TDH27432.1 bifunctional alpha,alpha-trehalose-phosphate synthase (UDP-forming)/trehalose-phosphatase [Segetibacter sp. 3557_3]
MSRLIIVSNRLPFSLDTSGDKPVIRQSSGGLVSALQSYFERSKQSAGKFKSKQWIGSANFSQEEWNAYSSTLSGEDFSIQPIFVDEHEYSDYYNGFSNSTIWPLFHYFSSLTEYQSEYYDAYKSVNELFAREIAAVVQPGDVVWIHDYQLMLLPMLLRQQAPEITIGFFLHIPFPSYELYRLLPASWRKNLLLGILGADLIGFHTYDYVSHFIQSVKMILRIDNHYNTIQFNNRLIKTELFPIGIDFEKFRDAVKNSKVKEISSDLRKVYGDKKIIFSVDRLDYTKGLNYRLKGFEQFLTRYPEWREKVIFILNIIPSRDAIPTYGERKKMIEENISMINGKFSTLHWQPLIYRYNHLAFEDLCALYQTAEVALITPLRDGMNLVAKEYVAASNNGGVLILSELAGAAAELNEALLLTPTDTDQMAEYLATALEMPLAEQKSRMKTMQGRLQEYDVVVWVNDFLDQLEEIKNEQRRAKAKLLDNATTEKIHRHYQGAKKRCFLLDYDGTLSPYTKLPSEAAPGKQVLQCLKNLSADPKNEVVIISGRDSQTLDKWLSHLPIHFVSEHGVFIKHKNGKWETQTKVSPEWKDKIRPMFQSYVTRCAGSLIEEKANTLSWHYRNTQPDLGFVRSRELLNNLLQLTSNTPIQVIDGNKVIEVRLSGMDKGITGLKLSTHFNADFMICIGDDTTDEDMFKALHNKAYTIRVGSETTAADYSLSSQEEVIPFLENLMQEQPSRKKRWLF